MNKLQRHVMAYILCCQMRGIDPCNPANVQCFDFKKNKWIRLPPQVQQEVMDRVELEQKQIMH